MGPVRGPGLGSDCSGVRGDEPRTASLPIATATKSVGSDSGSDAGRCITTVVEYTLYGEPIPMPRPRVGQGRAYAPPARVVEAKARHRETFEAARPSEWRTDGAFAVYVTAYRGTARKCDGDNLLKLPLDALNGLAFDDDSQVSIMRIEKRVDRDDPRTEVSVYRLEAES